jgi:hypothetical protein
MYLGRIRAHDVEHRVRVGVLDRRPAVRRGLGLVDDEHTGESLTCCLLVLVGPAAVVGHRLAAEVALTCLEVGIVDQHDPHLAPEIHSLEVVPVALWRLDAVAEEDKRSAIDRHAIDVLHRRSDGNLLALRQ